jgi:hypothetical protein
LRKLRILAVAVLGLLAFATVAFAVQENEYTVNGKVTPTKAGTKKKPVPIGLNFGYTVSEKTGKRPALIDKYKIHFAGLQVNSAVAKTCTAAKIDAAQSASVCPKGSLIGTGDVENQSGSSTDENANTITCHLELSVFNSGKNKAALFLEGGPSSDPAQNCPLTVAKAIDANFVRDAKGTALVFNVDDQLLHPAPGFDNAVVLVKSTIKKLTKKIKGKTRGYFESIGGCTNKKRAITVTFTPNNGTPSQKAQALVPCTK